MAACSTPPTAPSSSAAGGSTQAVTDAPAAPGAADGEVQVLNVHLQDYCSKGPIDKDQGADPWPITVTFSGHSPIVLPRMQHDFQISLPYGPTHFDSVTAAGYRDDGPTSGNIAIPFDDGRLVIEQRRRCEPPVVIPPPIPIPPPCVGCVPPVPVTCQEQHPPYAGVPYFNGTDGTATVTVSNEGDWTLFVQARYTDPNTGLVTVWSDKAHTTIHVACGETKTFTARYANWLGHIAQEWWPVVQWPNGSSVAGAIYTKH